MVIRTDYDTLEQKQRVTVVASVEVGWTIELCCGEGTGTVNSRGSPALQHISHESSLTGCCNRGMWDLVSVGAVTSQHTDGLLCANESRILSKGFGYIGIWLSVFQRIGVLSCT